MCASNHASSKLQLIFVQWAMLEGSSKEGLNFFSRQLFSQFLLHYPLNHLSINLQLEGKGLFQWFQARFAPHVIYANQTPKLNIPKSEHFSQVSHTIENQFQLAHLWLLDTTSPTREYVIHPPSLGRRPWFFKSATSNAAFLLHVWNSRYRFEMNFWQELYSNRPFSNTQGYLEDNSFCMNGQLRICVADLSSNHLYKSLLLA